ncbi:hypothetical protein BHE74_00048454, partial [Ensete ventricosum]
RTVLVGWAVSSVALAVGLGTPPCKASCVPLASPPLAPQRQYTGWLIGVFWVLLSMASRSAPKTKLAGMLVMVLVVARFVECNGKEGPLGR